MSVDLFRHVINEVKPLTKEVCFHLMGEPLAHPKLEALIEICERESVAVFFVSNGTLLRPRHHEWLTSPVFRQVSFSLHSFFDNYPDTDPSTYLNRIFDFVEYAQTKRPELFINFRLWNLNTVNSTSRENADLLSRVCSYYGIDHPTQIDVKKKKSFKIKGRLFLHFDSEFTWPSLGAEVLGAKGTCYGLKTHIGVLVDATVVPCCLDKEGDIRLGNLKESSLVSILQSEKAVAIRRGFDQGKLIDPLCQRCQYITRFRAKAEPTQAPCETQA